MQMLKTIFSSKANIVNKSKPKLCAKQEYECLIKNPNFTKFADICKHLQTFADIH